MSKIPRAVHTFVLVVFLGLGLTIGLAGRHQTAPRPLSRAGMGLVDVRTKGTPTPRPPQPTQAPRKAPVAPRAKAPVVRPAPASPAAALGSWTCQASHYGYDYRGNPFGAAMTLVPHGHHVRVTAPNGRSVKVIINDSGPYVAGRCIDLAVTAFEALGYSRGAGVISGVRVTRLD